MRVARIYISVLIILVGACSPPTAPRVQTTSSEPSSSPSQSAPAVAPSPSASHEASIVPTPTPTPIPSPSAPAAVPAAPDGEWTAVTWRAGTKLRVDPGMFSVFGWSGGYVSLLQGAGEDVHGNPIPVVIRASSSHDGIHWSPRASLKTGFSGAIRIESIVEGPSGLLALAYPYGDTCGGPESVRAMWTSPDGAHWQRVAMPKDFTTGSVQTVAGGHAGFIALGDRRGGTTQAIWTSPDGRAWTSRKLPTVSSGTLALDSVASFDRGFVLVGSVLGEGECGGPAHIRYGAWYSVDGASWTHSALPGASKDPNASLAVRRIRGHVVVTQTPFDDGPVKAWTSSDGKAWTRLADMPNDAWMSSASDGRHSVIVESFEDAPTTYSELRDDGTITRLAQQGEARGGGWVAVGPTGILVVNVDDGLSWLGLPS